MTNVLANIKKLCLVESASYMGLNSQRGLRPEQMQQLEFMTPCYLKPSGESHEVAKLPRKEAIRA